MCYAPSLASNNAQDRMSGFSFMANQPLGFQQEQWHGSFGKQQELLTFLSTTNPEELSGNRRDTVH
jgi:hypothetical protein